MTVMVEWNKPKLKRFKKAYQQELLTYVSGTERVFTFEGNEFVIDYAKYLIQYLEGMIK